MRARTRDAREQHLRVSDDGGGEKERERMEGRSDISHVAGSHIDAKGYTHACRHGGGPWGEGRGGWTQ